MANTQFDKNSAQFSLTPLDKEVIPRCFNNIDMWLYGYFGQRAFRFQKFFYHAPQRDKCFIAGIRTGKSRMVSFSALHFAQYHPGSRFLNTSISSEQAKIVFQNCLEYCKHPNFSHWIEGITSSPYPLIKLRNGAELWFRSLGYEGEYLRGFEFDFINVDEASYITRKTAIDVVKGRLLGINPLTNAQREGIIWYTSSPRGNGWLVDRWKLGDPRYPKADPRRYLSLRATTFDNPLLNQQLIEEIMAGYTESMIRQEMYGEFLDNPNAVFPYSIVNFACDEEMHMEVHTLHLAIQDWKRRFGGKSLREEAGVEDTIRHYELDPQPGHMYVASWDLGKKPTRNGRNATVMMVFDVTQEPWLMVGYRIVEGMGYVQAKTEIEELHRKYSANGAMCSTIIDSTGKGDVVLEFIEEESEQTDITGICYSSANKPLMIQAGKMALEHQIVRMPFIKDVVDQLTGYEMIDKDLAQDIVMTFCQAMYRARKIMRISTTSPSSNVWTPPNYRRATSLYQNPSNQNYRDARSGSRSGRLAISNNRRGTRRS